MKGKKKRLIILLIIVAVGKLKIEENHSKFQRTLRFFSVLLTHRVAFDVRFYV